MSAEAFIRRAETAKSIHKAEHPGYESLRRIIVGRGESEHFEVSVYEVPPGKAAYPYHYHLRNEELFLILSGAGLLKSPEGEKPVSAGDFLYFPNSEKGAHKLTNSSQSEPLVYADFDIRYDPEVAFYPDSGKVGIYGANARLLLSTAEPLGYYDGE